MDEIYKRVGIVESRILVHDAQIENLENALHSRVKESAHFVERLDGRIRAIERLVWVAVGGVTVISGLTLVILDFVSRIYKTGAL